MPPTAVNARRLLQIAAPLLFGLCIACASSQHPPDEATAPTSGATEPTLRLSQGEIFIEGTQRPQRSAWVQLVPADWPESEAGPAPVLGFGRLEAGDATRLHLWGLASGVDPLDLEIRFSETLSVAGNAKRLVALDFSGERPKLAAGALSGVSSGDIYFIIDPTLGGSTMLDSVVALARVTGSTVGTSDIHLLHQTRPIQDGDLALFVQASLDRNPDPFTVVLAPFALDTPSENDWLEAALPSLLARFQITNVGVEESAQWSSAERSPRSPELLLDEELDGYGLLVVVDSGAEGVRLNYAGWGTEPHPAQTVGLLEGGLMLPPLQEAGRYEEAFATSLLATALARRGEHAHALYVVTQALRQSRMPSALRYHLNEHLVVRQIALGYRMAALLVLNEDIAESQRTSDYRAWMNALSMRALLYQELNENELWSADISELLRLSSTHAPEHDVAFEQLYLAQALAAQEDIDASRAQFEQVIERAQAAADSNLSARAHLGLARLIADDDPISAELVLRGVDLDDESLDELNRLQVHLLRSENAAADLSCQEALSQLHEALQSHDLSTDPAAAAMAHLRSALIFNQCEVAPLYREALRQSSMAFLRSAQFDMAALAIQRLAMATLEGVHSSEPHAAAALLAEGRGHLQVSAELSLRLGMYEDSAQTYLMLGLLDAQLGQEDSADRSLTRAASIARMSGDMNLIFEVQSHLFQRAVRENREVQAELSHQELRIWGSATGRDEEVPEWAPTFQ